MEIPEKVEPPKPSPDAKDVKDFLKSTKKKDFKEVELDINPEDLSDGKDEEEKKGQDTPLDPTYDPGSDTRNTQDPWVFHAPEETMVEVTDNDKDLFFKSVLNDEPVNMNVQVHVGPKPIPVGCRSLSNFEIDTIYAAIDKRRDAGEVVTTAHFMTMLQRYSIVLQVTSFNGKTFEKVELRGNDPVKAVEDLESAYKKKALHTNQTRWQAILTALRIFSIKLKVCNDNILNENFWSPVDTD